MGGLGSFSAGLPYIYSCFCIQLEGWLDWPSKTAPRIGVAVGADLWLVCLSALLCDLSTSSRLDWTSSWYGNLRVPRGWGPEPQGPLSPWLWNPYSINLCHSVLVKAYQKNSTEIKVKKIRLSLDERKAEPWVIRIIISILQYTLPRELVLQISEAMVYNCYGSRRDCETQRGLVFCLRSHS